LTADLLPAKPDRSGMHGINRRLALSVVVLPPPLEPSSATTLPSGTSVKHRIPRSGRHSELPDA
jgi:hypothetical protein